MSPELPNPNEFATFRDRISSEITRFGGDALEILFPSTCRLCEQNVGPAEDFCRKCRARLAGSEERMKSSCRRCGLPGAGLAALPSDATTAESCPTCEDKKLAFDRCIALWTYDELVRTAVIAAKYGNRASLADALGRCLGDRCVADLKSDPADWVTSVPTPLLRRVQRGRGGSPILAEAVTRRLQKAPDSRVHMRNLLTITRAVKKQALLSEKDRRANIHGAFRVIRQRLVNRKHVLLVDDVMTSGATADEIATILKRSGARRVTVAVVARACGT
ncbi:MAG: double zinc ribbon domain-containing protein [Planctomycetota bacterium]